MKTITIRVPLPIAMALEAKARRDGTSLSRAAVNLLTEVTIQGPAKARRALHHDLDKFAGRWTRAEADEFDAVLREMRRGGPKAL